MFNAKAFHSESSAFKGLFRKDVIAGFGLALFVIVAGQLLIVSFGGEMFNVDAMCLNDWLYIILGTMPVMIFGEALRAVKKLLN